MKGKNSGVVVWKSSPVLWLLLGVSTALLGFVFYDGIERMVSIWSNKEEYGYGYLLPLISLFFVWGRKDRLERVEFRGSWAGVLLLLAGLFLYLLGELSTIYAVIEYALIFVIAALALSLTGWQGFSIIWVPVFLLFFIVPLPQFLYQGLSTKLQLVSSELGVAFIRLFDISVYLEGNVIDLGTYRLQVVEACSGLRYLFPLTSLAFIAAYIFRAPFWKRAVVFFSAIPITILMNSFRIGVIGVLVDRWGTSQAEGFLHYFEGWVIFMACMAILLLEIWLLSRIGGQRRSLTDSFVFELPAPTPPDATVKTRRVPASFLIAVVLVAATVPLAASLGDRQDWSPERRVFAEFPSRIGSWKSTTGSLEQIVVDALKLDDYYLADFRNEAGEVVSLYMAYYASQSKGESAHSPRTCIPGGGWQIKGLTQRTLDGITVNGSPLRVNRLEISKGDYRQLVYYWFQGRGRIITNEYLVKWFIFWDSLTRNRTDGALVRLTAYVSPGQDLDRIDERFVSFIKDMNGYLSDYIPD